MFVLIASPPTPCFLQLTRICSQANFALQDGAYAQAYIMLYRHSTLVLKHLPTHPEYNTSPERRRECRALSKKISQVVEELEYLKPEISRAYNEWERMRPADEPKEPEPGSATSYAHHASRDPALSGNARILDALENQDLAVDLAQQEITRRDTVRRATREAGLSQQEIDMRRRGGRWDRPDRPAPPGQDGDLRSQMEAARRHLDSRTSYQDDRGTKKSEEDDSSRVVPHHYNYPTIARSRPVAYERSTSQTSIPTQPPPQPWRPPKEPLPSNDLDWSTIHDRKQPPTLPRKEALSDYKALIPAPGAQTLTQSPPSLPPKTSLEAPVLPKKERLAFRPGGYLENGDPLRSIFIPKVLRQKFLEIAAPNTHRKLETCGILLGSPVNNALFIRCLLIPDQISTTDTCETVNESKMFDYCMSEDLLMVGWIHTHPTQTCFMSSRDLHTQAGYQIMMPESIAIVCAPKFEPE